MNRILLTICIFSATLGCAKEEVTTEKAPTPPAVATEFHALLDSLADFAPEAAVGRLEAFLNAYGHYSIADTVSVERDRFHSTAQGRYHVARELARQGEFTQAERILNDLADHLPDTPDGQSATQYLEFDFYFAKAQWLMIRQRYEETEVVANALLDHDLTPSQTNQVEMILDNADNVNAALSQSEKAQARSACRQVAIVLQTVYVEEGAYPASFSLEDAQRWGSVHGLSAIEDYNGSAHNFSFVGVSDKGRHRIRVVDGQIQN
jgi:hypothetical protein